MILVVLYRQYKICGSLCMCDAVYETRPIAAVVDKASDFGFFSVFPRESLGRQSNVVGCWR